MPVYLKGRHLHAHHGNQYRLENASGTVLLTHNNIASHRAYRNLLNPSKTNNKNEMRNLGRYIANKIRNERNVGNTKRKLTSMVEKILNHRTANTKPYENEYLAALETYRARVEPLRAARDPHFKFANKLKQIIKKGGTLTSTEKGQLRNANRISNHYTRLINAEDRLYDRAVKRWVEHQAQIKYWKWVRNRVLPEVKRLLVE